MVQSRKSAAGMAFYYWLSLAESGGVGLLETKRKMGAEKIRMVQRSLTEMKNRKRAQYQPVCI